MQSSYGDTGPSRTVQYKYDNSGRLINQQIGDVSASTGYDSFGNKIWVTDYNGNKSYYNFDALGRTTKVIDPEGNNSMVSYGFDNGNEIETSQVSSEGMSIISRVVYDGFGNKVEITDPNGNKETYLYNAAGKPTLYTDKNSNQTSYVYDTLGRQTTAIDANGGVLSNLYDSFNNIIEVIDKEGRHLYREFDWTGRMVYTKDALGNEARYEYSAANLPGDVQPYVSTGGKCDVENFTDANGNNMTTYKYGKQTLAVIDALRNKTSYQYDAFGELTATVDPKGNTTTLTYDLRGNKTGETTALGFSTTYQYDNNGNVINEINGEGQIKTFYNKNNQPVRKEYSDGNVKQFTYDNLGRLTRARDNYSDYSYLYDNNEDLTNRYDSINKETLAYEYDANGNRTRMIANGKTVNYEYDGMNQVTKETALSYSTTNLQISYTYSPMGRIINKTYSSGLRVDFSYDSIYRLTKINNTTNQTQFLSSFEYTYDSVGNRTKETEIDTNYTNSHELGSASGGVRVSTFNYDNAYRLTRADYDQGKFEEFTYDNSGNRLKKTSNLDGSNTITTAYVYDNDSRLLCEQKPSGNISYIYDRAGRLVKKTDGDKVERYQFNQRDLMTRYTVEDTGGNVAAESDYTYDVNNLRTVKVESPQTPGSVGDNTTRFTYDGDNILYEGPSFYLNNIMINGYEAEIQPLRMAVYVKDALGSVRGEIYDNPLPPVESGSPGIALKEFNYTAFGEMLSIGDQIAIDNDAKKGISYTGHYFDKDTKLYYARARYYDPGIGRFISSDPISDPSKRYSPAGLNRYVYGDNRPLYYTDPEGKFLYELFLAIAGAILGTFNAMISNFDELMHGDLLDYFANMNLGAISGAASLEMTGHGIPLYISLSTRGWSAGVGYSIGNAFTVGAGIHDKWDNSEYGFSVNAGLGSADKKYSGFHLGFSADVDYGPNGTSSGDIGFSAGFGAASVGVGLNFQNGQYAGYGFNGSIGGDIGNNYSIGLNGGMNFDTRGHYAGANFGVNIGYRQGIEGSNDSMLHNESIGISVSPDGKVTPYANYSATRSINIQNNAESVKKAGNKTSYEIEMERQGLQRDMAERMKTTVMSMQESPNPEATGMMVIGKDVSGGKNSTSAQTQDKLKLDIGADGTVKIKLEDLGLKADLGSQEEIHNYIEKNQDTINDRIKNALLGTIGSAGIKQDVKVELVLFDGNIGGTNTKIAYEYILSPVLGGDKLIYTPGGVSYQSDQNLKIGIEKGMITFTTKNQYGEVKTGIGFNSTVTAGYGKAELLKTDFGTATYKTGMSVTTSMSGEDYRYVINKGLEGGMIYLGTRGLGFLPQVPRWIPAFAH